MSRERETTASTSRTRIVLVLSAIAALGIGYWAGSALIGSRSPAPPSDLAATLWPEPRPLGEFHLVDHDGKPFGREQLRGNWSLLFFGYTHCPDVCPTTLGKLESMHERLLDSPSASEQTRFVFVSVDPDRDTGSRLKDYVTYFDPDFLGVSGSPEDLDALARQVGVVFAKGEQRAPGDYLVDHSASVVLIDPQARLYALFSPSLDADTMTRDYLEIRDHYSGG